MLIKKSLLLCFFFYFIFVMGTSLSLAAENLKALAYSAGDYAAWADVCDDPAGANVRSDFLSRANLLSPDEEAKIIKRFEDRYQRKKRYADKALKKCVQQGKNNCCSAVRSVAGRLNKAKSIYEIGLQKLVKATPSTKSSEPGTESLATRQKSQ